MIRRTTGIAIAASILLAAASAVAAPTPEDVDRARTFFNAGAQAYAKAEYADAARSFEQAYHLAPRPQLLFSLAQAERKQYFASNDVAYMKRAIVHYREYLEQVPSGGRRSEATEAKADHEARLARLDPQQAAAVAAPVQRKARLTVYSATPGAYVQVDGAPPQELPYFGDIEPGRHRVRVFAEGYFDEQREVSGDKPVDVPVDIPLKERPALVTVALDREADVYVDGRVVATAPVTRPIEVPSGVHVVSVAVNGKKAWSQEVTLQRGKPFRVEPKLEASGQRIVALSMLGVGAAGIVTGGVFGVLSLVQEDRAQEIEDARAKENISQERLDAHNRAIDRRDAFRTVSIVSLSAGAVLATTGAVLYLFDRPAINVVPPRSVEPGPAPRPPGQPLDVAAAPVVGPDVVGAMLVGRF
jgi:hypothetical protein